MQGVVSGLVDLQGKGEEFLRALHLLGGKGVSPRLRALLALLPQQVVAAPYLGRKRLEEELAVVQEDHLIHSLDQY